MTTDIEDRLEVATSTIEAGAGRVESAASSVESQSVTAKARIATASDEAVTALAELRADMTDFRTYASATWQSGQSYPSRKVMFVSAGVVYVPLNDNYVAGASIAADEAAGKLFVLSGLTAAMLASEQEAKDGVAGLIPDAAGVKAAIEQSGIGVYFQVWEPVQSAEATSQWVKLCSIPVNPTGTFQANRYRISLACGWGFTAGSTDDSAYADITLTSTNSLSSDRLVGECTVTYSGGLPPIVSMKTIDKGNNYYDVWVRVGSYGTLSATIHGPHTGAEKVVLYSNQYQEAEPNGGFVKNVYRNFTEANLNINVFGKRAARGCITGGRRASSIDICVFHPKVFFHAGDIPIGINVVGTFDLYNSTTGVTVSTGLDVNDIDLSGSTGGQNARILVVAGVTLNLSDDYILRPLDNNSYIEIL